MTSPSTLVIHGKQQVSPRISFHPDLGCQHNSEDTAMMTRRLVPSAFVLLCPCQDRRQSSIVSRSCLLAISHGTISTGAAFSKVSLSFLEDRCAPGWAMISCMCPGILYDLHLSMFSVHQWHSNVLTAF